MTLYANGDGSVSFPGHTINLEEHTRAIAVGEGAWIVLVDIDVSAHGVASLEPGLSYSGEARPRFTVRK